MVIPYTISFLKSKSADDVFLLGLNYDEESLVGWVGLVEKCNVSPTRKFLAKFKHSYALWIRDVRRDENF